MEPSGERPASQVGPSPTSFLLTVGQQVSFIPFCAPGAPSAEQEHWKRMSDRAFPNTVTHATR